MKNRLRRNIKTKASAALLFATLSSSVAISAPSLDKSKVLEKQIWTANDHLLPELETKVVRLLQTHPKNVFYHYLLSHLSVRLLATDPSDMRLMNQASHLAQQAIDLDKNSEFGYLALAELMDLMGHPKKGVSLLSEFNRISHSSSWRMKFALARLSIDSKSNEETLNLFEQSLSSPGAITEIIAPYASAVLQSSSKDNSTTELEIWDKKYPSPLFKHLIAIKKSENGQYQASHQKYQQILKNNPENIEALINDAIVLYKHLGSDRKSLALFEKLDQVSEVKIAKSIKPILFAHAGTVYLRLNKPNKAKNKFIEALKASSNLNSMVNFVSKSYKDNKKTSELVALLEEANIEIPGKSILHAYLGELYSETLGQHNSAIVPLANAITLEPERSEYYNALGLAYYRLQNLEESLKLFTAASMVDPKDSTAQYNKACVLARTGRTNEALVALTTAIKLDPNLEQVAANDSDFSDINKTQTFKNLVNLENKQVQVAH